MGQVQRLRQSRDGGTGRREPGCGRRVLVHPGARRRGTGRGGPGLRQLVLGQGLRPVHGGHPLVQLAPAHPLPVAGQGGQGVHVGRQGEGGLDDRGVAQHLARRHVTPLRDPVPGLPQLPYDRHLPAPAHLVHAGRTAPRVLARRGGRGGGDGVEFLVGPFQLALPVQFLLQRVPQVDQQLHVQGGVAQPGLGERAGGPVDGGVALLQRVAEHALDHRAESDPGEAGEAAGQLGVEQGGGHHAYFAQARQVLGGGVQDPFGAGQGFAQCGQVGAAHRVDQRGPGTLTAQLHQVGALAVAVSGGPFGVDGDGAGARGEGRDHFGEGVRVGDHRRNPLTGLQQGSRQPTGRNNDVVRGAAPGGGAQVCCGILGVGHRSRVSVYTTRPSPERSVDGRERYAGSFPGVFRGSPGRFPGSGSRGGYPGDPARGQWMIPVRSATATIPARSPVPSLRAIRARWDLTVRADRPIETPMALLDWPSATRRRTSTSRPESSR